MERLFTEDYPVSVLVGVDASDESLRAASWAATLAARKTDSIHMVHAWIWPLMKVDLEPVPGVANSGLRHAAQMVLENAQQAVLQVGTQAELFTQLAVGDAAQVLIAAAEKADIVVVGNRGLGGLYGRFLGSTGMRLIAHAPGPVLVVRGEERPEAPVLAAVDGSPEGTAALGLAAALARRLKAPLRIVHVVKDTGTEDRSAAATAERILHEARTAALEAVPELELSSEAVRARSAAKGLLKESAAARILILGAHGKGRRFEHAVGSTANAALQHSGAPILVARRG